jgi:hypothetical protein
MHHPPWERHHPPWERPYPPWERPYLIETGISKEFLSAFKPEYKAQVPFNEDFS